MVFYLNQSTQQRSWGPFATPMRAWRYLFGRKYTREEVTAYKESGWSVTHFAAHEVRR